MHYSSFPFLLIFLLSAPIHSQPLDTLWTQTFGNDDSNLANCLDQTDDGGFIIFGQSSPGYNGYLLKVNDHEDEEWSQLHGDENSYDCFYSGYQASDGGFILRGIIIVIRNGAR